MDAPLLPPSPTSQSKTPMTNAYPADVSPPDHLSFGSFRAPSSSFSSTTTSVSGTSFSSIDDGDLPAISRDFARPLKADDSKRPKTAGGLLQRGGWGFNPTTTSTIQETGPSPVFDNPFTSSASTAPRTESISPDALIDPHNSGRRASEPQFNLEPANMSLPSHMQFLQANNLPSTWAATQVDTTQPAMGSLTLAGNPFGPVQSTPTTSSYAYDSSPPESAIATAELRPQTSDGIPSYLSQQVTLPSTKPPPTFHPYIHPYAANPPSRKPQPLVGINGLQHNNVHYHPARSSSSTYPHHPAQDYFTAPPPPRSQSLDHSRFGLTGAPGQQQQQQQQPKKRPRRRFDEIERLYACGFEGCEKAYGTLNHLNAHVSMQKHGEKRLPGEFKDLRKAWRKKKRDQQAASGSGYDGQHDRRGSDDFESSDGSHPRRESDVSASAENISYFRSHDPAQTYAVSYPTQPPPGWLPARPAYEYEDAASRPTSSSSVASSASGSYQPYPQPGSYLPHPHPPQRRLYAPSHVPIPHNQNRGFHPSGDFPTPTQQNPQPHRSGSGGGYPFQTLSMPMPPQSQTAGGAYGLVGNHPQFAFES